MAKTLLLGVVLGTGVVTSATVHVPAARSQASACIPVLTTACPTVPSVPTTSVPTISLPLPTGSTTTAAATTSSGSSAPSATTAADTSSRSSPQTPSAVFDYSVHAVVRKHGGSRWIDIGVSLSQSASVSARLKHGKTTTASSRFGGRQGLNRFRLVVPRRAKGGLYTLTVRLVAGNVQRTVTRSLVLPR